MKLELQINQNLITEPYNFGGIMVTPNIDEDYWLYRVPLTDDQAIVGFPKFGVVGIGFQYENDDWNLNLPSGEDAIKIYNHIRRNKGNSNISRGRCIEAILMIQHEVERKLISDAVKEINNIIATSDDSSSSIGNNVKYLSILGKFLRETGSYEIAQTIGR